MMSTARTYDGPDEEPSPSFAGLLRQLRIAARLTQEELAESARLSPRSISDLERGINRTAHKDTAISLAEALRLQDPVRSAFVAAARGRAPVGDVLAAMDDAPATTAGADTTSRRLSVVPGSDEVESAGLIDAARVAASNGGVAGIYLIVLVHPRAITPCQYRRERGARAARARTRR